MVSKIMVCIFNPEKCAITPDLPPQVALRAQETNAIHGCTRIKICVLPKRLPESADCDGMTSVNSSRDSFVGSILEVYKAEYVRFLLTEESPNFSAKQTKSQIVHCCFLTVSAFSDFVLDRVAFDSTCSIEKSTRR